MTGAQLQTLATEINGGASIGETLLFQFINIFRAIVEQRRPWMVLRSIDTSKTVSATTQSAWNTSIDLSTIVRSEGDISGIRCRSPRPWAPSP